VRVASKTDVLDAPSGFRAISRSTAIKLNVFNPYTYTIETIIQAGLSNLRVKSVPISTNADLRPSRLVKSISSYVRRSLITILRVFITYRPLYFFFVISTLISLPGLLLSLRFLYYYLVGSGSGHVQSLILASLLLILGALTALCGLLADLISVNRKLLEKNLEIAREAKYNSGFATGASDASVA
jgi:hypothetical protein